MKEKRLKVMKKTFCIAIIAALISATLAGCGCENKNKTATADEAVSQAITEIATDDQGNTYYNEVSTISGTKSETDTEPDEKAEGDSTSPTSGTSKSNSKTNSKSSATKVSNNGNSGSDNNGRTTDTNNSGNARNNNSGNSGNSGSAGTNNNSNNSSGNTDNYSVGSGNYSGGNSSGNSGSTSNKSNGSSGNSNSGGSSNSNSGSGNGGNSPNSRSNQSSYVDPHAGKTWHDAVYKTVNHPAVTKQIKVVDQEAYSYEEPVYDWRTFCNTCGEDITGNVTAHQKAHYFANETGGYHDDYVQVGTKTVNVPEKSHEETVVVTEAWTEQVLVKEAGWY